MKKHIFLITGCFTFGIVTIVALYAISDTIVHKRNSFLRIFPPHPISEPTVVLDLKYNSYYIAGADADHIYFGNSTAPSHVVMASTMLADTQHISINSRNLENLKFTSVTVTVKPPYFFIADGTLPGIFRGKVGEWVAERFRFDSAYFSASIPMTKNTFALRSSNVQNHEDMLGIAQKDTLRFFGNILEKQIDGVFCTDGMFSFNKELSRLVYTYYYRNQFIVMDTNLNVLYRGNTIDTVSHAKISVDSVIRTTDRSYTLSAPPLMVNKKSATWDNWLLVNSDLLSKNEDKTAFNQASVIDVYDLTNGIYQFSFYLHHFNNQKMRSYQIVNAKLYALFDHFVVLYDLNEQLLNKTKEKSL